MCSCTTRWSIPELVAEAPTTALVVSRAGRDQDDVNELLVRYGQLGLDVVRLKGGDPFVFGRGGEEALVLREAGIDVEIVPGLSSVAAVPGAAGIPITHRGHADRVTFATAHDEDGAEPDYDALVAAGGTLVLFMGLGRASSIAEGLVAAGLDPSTPAAIVSRGTLPEQREAMGRVDELGALAEGMPTPALIVIGEVVDTCRRDHGLRAARAPRRRVVAARAAVCRARSSAARWRRTAGLRRRRVGRTGCPRSARARPARPRRTSPTCRGARGSSRRRRRRHR